MIIGVALKHPGTGEVHVMRKPNRHHHVIRQLGDAGMSPEYISECDQGFIDEFWVYMDREAAATYALLMGQIQKLNVPPRLYSEDLW
jgi:hypothetical protein